MEKPVIELIPSDGVLMGWNSEFETANGDVKGCERGETMRVFRRVHLQVVKQFRSDPAGAGLESREILPVEDQAIHALLFQAPGTG